MRTEESYKKALQRILEISDKDVYKLSINALMVMVLDMRVVAKGTLAKEANHED